MRGQHARVGAPQKGVTFEGALESGRRLELVNQLAAVLLDLNAHPPVDRVQRLAALFYNRFDLFILGSGFERGLL